MQLVMFVAMHEQLVLTELLLYSLHNIRKPRPPPILHRLRRTRRVTFFDEISDCNTYIEQY